MDLHNKNHHEEKVEKVIGKQLHQINNQYNTSL